MIERSINCRRVRVVWWGGETYLFGFVLVVSELDEQVRIHVHNCSVVGPRVQPLIQKHDRLLQLQLLNAALRFLDQVLPSCFASQVRIRRCAALVRRLLLGQFFLEVILFALHTARAQVRGGAGLPFLILNLFEL